VARGESDKSVARSSALGVWGVFGAISLGVILSVVWSTRSCDSDPPPPPAMTDPFARARNVALGWRDCVPEYPDPPRDLDAALRNRGYVRVAAPGLAHELPMTITTEDLDGACGVVAVIGEPTSTINSIGAAGQQSFPSCVARLTTIGVCGVTTVRAAGIGQARAAIWTFPGLTPQAIEDTGIPADAALAHAEAEALLARQGIRPTPQVLVMQRGASDPLELPPGPAPPQGCAGWVTTTVGFGPVEGYGSGMGSHSSARERGLVLSLSCSDGSGMLRLTDLLHDGGTIYSIPYDTGDSGPAVPAEDTALSRLPAVRRVSTRQVVLPQ
jgi:hypothetical protein